MGHRLSKFRVLLVVVEVKRENIRIGNDQLLVFERIITHRSGCGQNTSHSPHAFKCDEASCVLDSFSFSYLGN